jgi:hypothetical protein
VRRFERDVRALELGVGRRQFIAFPLKDGEPVAQVSKSALRRCCVRCGMTRNGTAL